MYLFSTHLASAYLPSLMYYTFMGLVAFCAIYSIKALSNIWSFWLGLFWIIFAVQFIIKIESDHNKLLLFLIGFFFAFILKKFIKIK